MVSLLIRDEEIVQVRLLFARLQLGPFFYW
jgi:hypothetical protein